MIPGHTYTSYFGKTIVVRSVNFVTREVTLEYLSSNPLSFDYCKTSFYDFEQAGYMIDRQYCWEVLEQLLAYARARITGRHKVSKLCVNRLQRQWEAV